ARLSQSDATHRRTQAFLRRGDEAIPVDMAHAAPAGDEGGSGALLDQPAHAVSDLEGPEDVLESAAAAVSMEHGHDRRGRAAYWGPLLRVHQRRTLSHTRMANRQDDPHFLVGGPSGTVLRAVSSGEPELP